MVKNIHEIRDPIHVFIRLDSDERKVLDSQPFQRLRCIHQLALTFLVYPGASHRRFEHSLGVMELASRVFDVVTNPDHLTDEIKEASRAVGSSQIHVGYFSHLVSYGLFGSIFLFTFWFGLVRDLYKKAKSSGFYGPLFAFLVFLWFNATAVDYYLRYPGLIIAIVFNQYYFTNYLLHKQLNKGNINFYTKRKVIQEKIL